MVAQQRKWGDLLEDEEELPPPSTSGPDARGQVVSTECECGVGAGGGACPGGAAMGCAHARGGISGGGGEHSTHRCCRPPADFRNDKGEVIKRTTKTRVIKLEKKVYKARGTRDGGAGWRRAVPTRRCGSTERSSSSSKRRRELRHALPLPTPSRPTPHPQAATDRRATWQKFGDAKSERATDAITGQAPEEVPFERIVHKKPGAEEKKPDFNQAMSSGGSSNSMIVGSLRDMLYKKRMERQLLAAKGLISAPERPPDEVRARGSVRVGAGGRLHRGDWGGRAMRARALQAPLPRLPPSPLPPHTHAQDGPGGMLPPPGAKSGWVPPSLRSRLAGGGDAMGDAMNKRRDENSVRVSNLSEDTTEDDLYELFGAFGHIQRVFVAKDRETGERARAASMHACMWGAAGRRAAELERACATLPPTTAAPHHTPPPPTRCPAQASLAALRSSTLCTATRGSAPSTSSTALGTTTSSSQSPGQRRASPAPEPAPPSPASAQRATPPPLHVRRAAYTCSPVHLSRCCRVCAPCDQQQRQQASKSATGSRTLTRGGGGEALKPAPLFSCSSCRCRAA